MLKFITRELLYRQHRDDGCNEEASYCVVCLSSCIKLHNEIFMQVFEEMSSLINF